MFPDLKPVDEEEKSWQQCEMTRRTGILRLAEGLREKNRDWMHNGKNFIHGLQAMKKADQWLKSC